MAIFYGKMPNFNETGFRACIFYFRDVLTNHLKIKNGNLVLHGFELLFLDCINPNQNKKLDFEHLKMLVILYDMLFVSKKFHF